MHTDLETWPELLPFRQPMPAGRPSRYFVVAVFISVAMHAFLVFLLWVVATDRAADEPMAPSIRTPLIVSLVSLPPLATASHDGPDREAASAAPHTDPPAQHSQSTPERARRAEHKAEAESVVTSKGQRVPGSEAPEGKSLGKGATPSIDQKAAYRIAHEVGRKPVSEAETVMTSKGQEVPGSEAPRGESLGKGATPSIDLEAAFRIAREVGRESMSESEVQRLRFEPGARNERDRLAATKASPLNCKTAYAKMGLLVIPFAIIHFGCVW